MEELLVPVLYVAIPAIILMLAFVAFLRKEEQEIEEDLLQEKRDAARSGDHSPAGPGTGG